MFKTKVEIFFLIVISFLASAQVKDSLTAGRLAPNFILEDIDGDFIELNEFVGKGLIIISFYASICKPCREEIEAFSIIYNKYKDEGLTLIAISTDDERTIAKVKPYIRSKGYKFPVLYDTNRNVARVYYAQLVPFSVLINMDGIIVCSDLGYMHGDEIEVENKVKELLKE